MYDWLIVGAGFTGAVVAERLASQYNKSVLVVDRRDHIAGNAFDSRDKDGTLYHNYGPHIFHTNSSQIVDYLSLFTDWRPYEHRVLAVIRNRLVPVPFNFTSIDILFERPEAETIKSALVERYGLGSNTTILKLRAEASPILRKLADFIFEFVFLGYTIKQWGIRPEELSSSVTDRVPVRISYDDRYFQDHFQNMPKNGYAALFENILSHPNIRVELQVGWDDVKTQRLAREILFTGAIDEFFDYQFGSLPYRSLRFDFQSYHQRCHQPVAQINYPNAELFTRITEMNHLTAEFGTKTLVAIEYPMVHEPNRTIPYYPIPNHDNQTLHMRYLDLARSSTDNVHFAGRLADYRYYNMDQAVGRALSFVKKLGGGRVPHAAPGTQ